MRRTSALVLTLALVASTLGVAATAASSVQPATIAPGTTPDTGNLYVDPTTFSEGQSVKITANFPSGVFDVKLYKESATPGEWTEVATQRSDSFGNARFTDYQVNGTQTLYARVGADNRTEEKTLTPSPAGVIAPTGPDVGNLYVDPATFAAGDDVKITANFPSGVFDVTLYKKTAPEVWTPVGTTKSNSYGNAYFDGYQVDESQELFARKANNERTEVKVVAPSPELTLSIRRGCTGNVCGSTATASGELDPVQANRPVELQYLSGSTWKQIGDEGTTSADGKVAIPFSLSGVSQWSTRDYRLVIEGDGSTPTITSRTIKFMPGPTALGSNVLRVDVEKGAYPSSKSQEYTGEATLSVNGAVTINRAQLEKFGVRGSSTASYAKKPYKLKFDKSPKNTTVFGMGADKSWTLLASYLDQSFVREKVGLDLGRRMDNIAWTPDSRYVEMFVNDQYRGAYLMTESVKIDGDRVDVDEEEGMILEVDGNSVSNSSLGFLSTIGKIAFKFKDPDERKTEDDGSVDPTGVTSAKLSAAKARVNALESVLYSSSKRAGPNGYAKYLDVDSTIDYYLVKEFMKDNDADFHRSHYFSWDPSDPTGASGNPLRDGKFHFGPAWDFDRSSGNVDPDTPGHTYVASPFGWYLKGVGTQSDGGRKNYRTHWYVQLFKDAAFNAALEARWLQVRTTFEDVYQEDVVDLRNQIGVGADNDRKRWAGEPKRYQSEGSYADEIESVTEWYQKRFNWIDVRLDDIPDN